MEILEKIELMEKIARAFSPSAPSDVRSFAGRTPQLNDVINACGQRGQHVVLFGERGAGKTSLVNALAHILRAKFVMPDCGTVNCDQTTTFASLWRAIFSEIPLYRNPAPGRVPSELDRGLGTLAKLLPEVVTPHAVRTVLETRGRFLIIIDEIDRIKDRAITMLLADTIKSLSDHAVDTTLVLVGVAESVDTLLAEHESVQRALIQVHMPRMSKAEVDKIIDYGLAAVGMMIEPTSRERIFRLSQGLPHYAHLLGMHSALAAAAEGRRNITIDDTHQALRKALKQAQQSVALTYERAATTTRNTLHPQVLLACALARTDEHGYFTAGDVATPLGTIMKKDCPVSLFSQHLNAFCEDRHGSVLHKTAMGRGYKYKFRNAITQPYIIMKALDAGSLTDLESFAPDAPKPVTSGP
jgi:Cdc6-like AAA superfamily ATPase